jgi:uncharacterized phosphosugar-binding protein
VTKFTPLCLSYLIITCRRSSSLLVKYPSKARPSPRANINTTHVMPIISSRGRGEVSREAAAETKRGGVVVVVVVVVVEGGM